MKITRRIFILPVFLAVPLLLSAQQKPQEKLVAPRSYFAYVGTYTTKTASKGIYAFRYDANSGKLTPLGVAAETLDPSWVAIHPSGKFLYAANEAGKNSTISAFAVDPQSGKLTLLNQLPALGEDPCYISFDHTGRYIFVANYTSGNVVVFPIGADGKLGAATANVHDEGKLGPNKERQEAPHAHWIGASPDNRYVLVSDLGLDAVLVYPFDASSGVFARDGYDKVSHVELKAGSGPRHLAFTPDGRWLFSVSELSSSVTWFLYDALRGGAMDIVTAKMLPKGFKGRNDAAEIEILPNEKFLYASNRGRDSIVVYSIDSPLRKLTQVADVPTDGKEPRHFAIDPSGNYLLAENQLSDKIVVFRIDQKTGALTATGDTVDVPTPVCIAFTPAE
jgi:6-phosphogluconolactonase